MVTPTINVKYCPVRFLMLWFWTRGVIYTTFSTFDDLYNSKTLFMFKKSAENNPCWCTIPHGVIQNNFPLKSQDIGKRVFINSVHSGLSPGSITGHSMRRALLPPGC